MVVRRGAARRYDNPRTRVLGAHSHARAPASADAHAQGRATTQAAVHSRSPVDPDRGRGDDAGRGHHRPALGAARRCRSGSLVAKMEGPLRRRPPAHLAPHHRRGAGDLPLDHAVGGRQPVLHPRAARRDDHGSRARSTLYFAALASAFLLRSAARAIWRRRVPPERALVLGRGKLADAVSRKLALEPGHHLSVLEYSAATTSEPNGNGNGSRARTAELKVEELSKEDLEFLLAEAGVERVVLALPELDEATLARVVVVLPRDGREAERDAADAGDARHGRAAQPHRRDAGDRVRHLGHVVVDDGDQARRRRRALGRRARGPGAADARDRDRRPAHAPRARPCSGRSAPGATASPSRSSSSARCATTPRSASPR